MASLYKKPACYMDRKTGKKVRGRSKKWWGKYRDASGTIRRVPLAARWSSSANYVVTD